MTESRKGYCWKGPLDILWPKPPSSSRAIQSRCPGPHLDGFWYLWGCRLHNLPRQPVPVLGHAHSKILFPDVQTKLLVFQFVPLPLVRSKIWQFFVQLSTFLPVLIPLDDSFYFWLLHDKHGTPTSSFHQNKAIFGREKNLTLDLKYTGTETTEEHWQAAGYPRNTLSQIRSLTWRLTWFF